MMPIKGRLHSRRIGASGFTLVEIIIAIVILAGLSLLTTQAIQNGAASKDKLNREIAADAAVRDTLRVIERDVSLAFHHRDIYTQMLNQIDREKNQPAAGQQAPPVPGAPQGGDFSNNPTFNNPLGPGAGFDPYAQQQTQRQPPRKLTQFIGDGQSMHFTTLSNVRLMRDSKESEQAEVGYFLRNCRSRSGRPGAGKVPVTSQCLIRRLSPLIDQDVTRGGNEVVVLEHVQEFKLRYFGPGRDDWVETWKTGDAGDALSKENFPLAVEVAISVHDTKDKKAKKVSMTMVAPIHFPNNPPRQQGGPGGQPR